MAKIKIPFNGTTFNIEESTLSEAKAILQNHLSSNMSGSGAVIKLGGVSYNIDSSKLNAAGDIFAAYLDETSGGASGEPMLAPGLYETGAIALYEAGDIEAASAMLVTSWDELEANGVIAISEGTSGELPETNEYGFYFGVVYSLTIGNITLSFTFNEDGSVISNQNGEIMELPAGTVAFGDHSIDMTALNMPVLEVSRDGTQVGANGTIFSMDSSVPPKGTVYLPSLDINNLVSIIEGDLVLPNDGRATSFTMSAFINQTSLTGIIIPDSVTIIGGFVFYSCRRLSSVVIPDSVTSIGDSAFALCDSLNSVVIPDSVTTISNNAFDDCIHLLTITFNGTTAQWNAIEKGTNWNRYVPATHVHCTDGDVAL